MVTAPLTTLPLSSAVNLATSALAWQGEYGVITDLAREYEVSRQRVYEYRERAREVLVAEFRPPTGDPTEFTLRLTEQDLRRAVVALRVMAPSSFRDIEELLPVLYGRGWSYGKVWGEVAEAERRAGALLKKMDLSAVQHVALDEMFSQGQPVFGGIDLKTQYLFQLEVRGSRSGEEWAKSLAALRDSQGLVPGAVVKDGGRGLGKGVRCCWPDAEQRDDIFHGIRLVGQEAHRLERRAYCAIYREEELAKERRRARTSAKRRSLGQRLRRARRHTIEAMERFDQFEALYREVERLLALADRGSGRLRTSDEVREGLTRVAEEIQSLGGKRARQVARYLRNRAAGFGRYLDHLGQRLDEVSEEAGGQAAVEGGVRLYQAMIDASRRGSWWEEKVRQQELEEAVGHLLEVSGGDVGQFARTVSTVAGALDQRHRASSAIENLNSVLRPYLVVQKCAHQGFLDLFRFYWNTRTRRWGKGKGTSPYEALTGQRVDDWLSLLGYPPSETLDAAA